MTVYLSLGSNLGNREETINKALELLATQIGPLIKRSSFYYSKPWGFTSEHDFCNICASFDTSLDPFALLRVTQAIEVELGRTEKSQEGIYHDRVIDIDILQYFDNDGKEINVNCQLSTVNSLTIPHKNMKNRDFVMIPLKEIAENISFL